MKTIIKKTKDLLFETRKSYYQNKENIKKNVSISLGFRKIFFAQTYDKNADLLDEFLKPHHGINAVVYIHRPQVLMNQAKDKIVMDPAVCFRLELSKYKKPDFYKSPIQFRKMMLSDIDEVNDIYKNYGMFPICKNTAKNNQRSSAVTYFVATNNNKIVGIIIGVNHVELFNSPEKGCTLWGLAVMPGVMGRGVGKRLMNYIVEHYQTKGLSYIDLYVSYDNKKAIDLYKKLGFKQIARFYLLPKDDLPKFDILKSL